MSKIICAISGGVDSAVAAGLLKKQGHNVMGLFLNMHKNFDSSNAQKVAKKLSIPLKVLNVRQEFKKRIINYFIQEYKNGRTPNPCVMCNKWIKFKFLIKKMTELDADYVATGHYCGKLRITDYGLQNNSKNQDSNYQLLTAKDEQKDQSYFLWTLTQKQLKHALFPIGDYTKDKVKKTAKQWGLSAYKTKESQEICFIQDIALDKFLKSHIKTKKGPIITTDNKKIGEHQGLPFYTIGQRKGIKVGGIGPARQSKLGVAGGPFYVAKKDAKNNTLIVVKSENSPELYKKEMIVEKINWISGKEPKLPLNCRIKIRYLHPANPAIIKKRVKNKLHIVFDKKQRAITSGQSAVFYKRNEILGGGIIS